MEIRVKVENVDNVLGMLTKDINLEPIMIDSANKIKEEAQRLCPVDTGRLQKSLKAKVEMVGVNRIETSAYTDVPYATYVEFGTGRRGDGTYPHEQEMGFGFNYGEIAGQTAQPYLYPALLSSFKDLIGEIKHVLTKK